MSAVVASREDRRAERAGQQASVAHRAKARRCPKCSRLSALVSLRTPAGLELRVCRFCKHHAEGAR